MKLIRQLFLSQSLFLSELCDQRAGIRLPHNVSPFGFTGLIVSKNRHFRNKRCVEYRFSA